MAFKFADHAGTKIVDLLPNASISPWSRLMMVGRAKLSTRLAHKGFKARTVEC
jgi:hypothetical protein